MDVFNIAELNRLVLLILMATVIFWVWEATTLKDIEISTAKEKLEVTKLEYKLTSLKIEEMRNK